MRAWIDLFENHVPTVLYHGTSPQGFEGIKAEGGLRRDKDTSWREFGKGVYLTDDPGLALSYGPVVLQIDVGQLNTSYMMPDDHELADSFTGDYGVDWSHRYPDGDAPTGIHECDWLTSLSLVNQCQYLSDFPMSAIRLTDGKRLS
jgi:hypothetical protein